MAPQPQETPACLSLSISSPATPGSRCAVSTGTRSLACELIPRIQPWLTGRARGESSPEGSHSSVPATDFRPERGLRPRSPFMPLLPLSQFSQKPGDGPPTFSSLLPGGRQLHSCELTGGCPPRNFLTCVRIFEFSLISCFPYNNFKWHRKYILNAILIWV